MSHFAAFRLTGLYTPSWQLPAKDTPSGHTPSVRCRTPTATWATSRWQLRMRQGRLPLDDVAFATVIDATVSGGVTAWRVALQLLQEEQELRIQVSVVTFSSALNALAKARQWQLSIFLLQSGSLDVSPNAFTYGSVINACERASDWSTSLQLLQGISFGRGSLDVVSASGVLGACARSNQWESACDVLCKLGLSLQLDSVAYSTTISSFGRAPWPQATFLLGVLLQRGLQADVISFNASMGSQPETWRVAQGLLKTMRMKMIRSTVVTWGSLLRLSPWCLAHYSLASAVGRGAELNDWCRAAAGGPWPLALGLLLDAEVPNTLAANAVMKRLREAGQWQLSSELLGLMEADITSYDEVMLRGPRQAVEVLETAQLESDLTKIREVSLQ